MKAYVGNFKKKDGTIREMVFAKLEDLPDSFLEKRIIGSGNAKEYSEGMELVWDLEADNFRVFNHNTALDELEEIEW